MGETFDPYYKWLAIPPQDQPPHHYRLLGVPLFEPDPDVIESAADQRMSHLRALRGSQQQTLSQRLLNEIAAAKVCLLDARRREAYDRELRHKLAASIPAIVRPPAARPLVVRPPAPAARTSVITIEPRRASLGANRRRRFASAAVLCGLFLAAMVGGGLLIAINRRPQSEVQKAPANLVESAMATPTQPEAAHEPAVSPVENGLAVNDGRPIAVPESEPSSPDWIRGAVLAIDCEAASKMERDGITRFRDLSGQNNDAELHDGIQTAGKVGEGIKFTDTGGFLQCGDAESLNATNEVTVAIWANAGAWGTRNLVSKDDWEGGGVRGYVLRQMGADRFDFTIGAKEWRGAESGSGMQTGRWYHVAGAFDGKLIRVYVDGVERGTTAYEGVIDPSHYTLRVGSCQFSPERQFVGVVDEIAVWNRALSPDEIRSLYDYSNQGKSYCQAIAAASPKSSSPPRGDAPPRLAVNDMPASATTPSADNFELPEISPPAERIDSWFALADGGNSPKEGSEKVCAADRSLHTALSWACSPEEAAAQAAREGKLLFLIHVSGNFEDPGFT